MEKYPIIIAGKTEGELSVTAQGAKTLFRADCSMIDGVMRLSVYGGGKNAHLGVLSPRGDRLQLEKKLSRSEMRGFPETIEYAAPPDEAPRKSIVKDDSDDIMWEKACDGALFFMDGARSLVALPVGDKRLIGQRHELRTIDGEQYAVLSPETYRIVR